MRNNMPLYEVVRIRVRTVIDDALGGTVVYSRQTLQIVGRGMIDIDGALLLDAFDDPLRNSLSVTRSGRSGAGRLLANFVRAAFMGGAAGEGYECQRNQKEKPHTDSDAMA